MKNIDIQMFKKFDVSLVMRQYIVGIQMKLYNCYKVWKQEITGGSSDKKLFVSTLRFNFLDLDTLNTFRCQKKHLKMYWK